MDSSRVRKLPFDFDIFSESIMTWPLQKKALGQYAGSSQTAAWLNSDIVKWFWMRSFPEHLKSTGYQNLNSWRILSSKSLSSVIEASGSEETQKM
mmetsp:Transcript_48107/g.155207  ORF Transcript_48107/g.155207 Transcript_48107/m.155207 type:complete len:95 (-) Transcript_48107:1981-2265(-)